MLDAKLIEMELLKKRDIHLHTWIQREHLHLSSPHSKRGTQKRETEL